MLQRTPQKLPPGWVKTDEGYTQHSVPFFRAEKQLAAGKVSLYVELDADGYWKYRWDNGKRSGGGHGYEARSLAHAAQMADQNQDWNFEFPGVAGC